MVLIRLAQVVASVAIICSLAVPQALAQPDFGPEYTPTRFGPMGPAGKDMLVKVRLAGLWEGPAGRLGLEKSANPLVKEAGRHLVMGHTELDAKVLELGRTLNVQLPSEANADQQGWIAEMTNAPAGSAEFDRIFANRLRAAHGGVYKFLAVVRTGTRNTLIRDFAKRCMEVVLDHIQVLESTGMVDFNDTKAIPLAALAAPAASSTPTPAVPQPAPTVPRAQNIAQGNESGGSDVLLGVLAIVAVAGAIYLWIGGWPRRSRSSRQ
jgi:putative membrane protein